MIPKPLGSYSLHNYSARHDGKVLVGQLDGSTEVVTIKDLADMRRWAPRATTEDWTPSITPQIKILTS